MTLAIGVRVPRALFSRGRAALARFVGEAEAAGIDRLWVGDHVTFKGGQGYDGLIQAAMIAALSEHITVETAVYLLPLRHPVLVARQVATVAELAPGRLVLGIGVGGDDPREVANCGVDPRLRGRRTDESMTILRALLAGDTVDHDGESFTLRGASILPAPMPPVPMIVGGRSTAGQRRAGRLGDGWLGVFVTPEAFAEGVDTASMAASSAGRATDLEWGILSWCGFGASRDAARPALVAAMEALYQQPFDRFERYSPYGTPEDVASFLGDYVKRGATSILLGAIAEDPADIIAGAHRVRSILQETVA